MPQLLIIHSDSAILRAHLHQSFAIHEAKPTQAMEILRQVRFDGAILDDSALCKRIKSMWHGLPVLLVLNSVNADPEPLADDLLFAPVRAEELEIRAKRLFCHMPDHQRNTVRAQQDLLDMVMHDFGNMVSAILSALSMSLSNPESGDMFIRDAYTTSQFLTTMIKDALDVSRLESHKLIAHRTDVPIDDLLVRVAQAFRGSAEERAVQIVIQNDAPILFSVDPILMQRVIANLVINALKYAPPSSAIAIGAAEHKGTLTMWVHDDGPGIAADVQKMIFDKWATAEHFAKHHQHLGHGLGLTFAKMAIEAHGGTLAVTSAPGCGATFTLTIPPM
jgi:two-component system, sensor histidine kinase and response regulator